MFALLFALVAHAETPEETRLTERMKALAPFVEAEAGRRFDRLPTLRVGDHDAVLASLRTSQQVFSRIARVAVTKEQEQRLVELVDQSMAVYSPGQDTVWVLADRLEEVGTQLLMDEAGRAGSLHCSIAHELTHALQSRYTDLRADAGVDEASWLALVEGHASLVARRVCRRTEPPAGWRGFDVTAGLDNLLAPGDSPLALRYKVGPVYVARLEAEGGKEAVWRAFTHAVPTEAGLRAAVTAEVGRAWESGRYSRGLLEARFDGPVKALYMEAPSRELQGLVSAGGRSLPLADVPAALGGEVAVQGVPGFAVLVVRVALDGSTSAEAWLRRRAELLTSGAIGLGSGDGPLAPILAPPTRRDDLAAHTPGVELWLSGKAKGRFDEVWGVRDGILAGVSTSAARRRDGMRPETLAELLGAALAAPEPGVAGLDGLLEGSPPGPPPADVPMSATYALIPAVLALYQGDPTGCAARVEGFADRSALQPSMLILGWECALKGKATELAERLMARVPAGERPASMLFDHVDLLADGDRQRDALSLLDTIPATTEADRREVADRRIELYTELQDWRAVAVAARDPVATPQLRLDVGYRLYDRGRYREAMAVIGPLCGMTADPDACRWMREALGR